MKKYSNIINLNRLTDWKYRISLFGVLFLTVFSSFGQKTTDANTLKTIVGVVLDARSKQPINAAEINIPSFKYSAVTDEKGKFTMKVPSGKSLLRVTAFDYNTRDVSITGKDSVVITLYSDAFSSELKSVSLPTGTTFNTDLSTSAKSVTDFSLSEINSPDEALQTALGGDVRAVTRSGVSGEGASLFIRGINSLNANAQPLFVVDGVIWNNMYEAQSVHDGFFSNPLDNIDVNDIENISVLKDGTSIYGSKGANGVIIVNTKRSKSMVTKINLSILNGVVDQPGTLPMMNGEQFRTYASDMFGSKGLTGNEVSALGFLQTTPSVSYKNYAIYHNNTNWSDQVYQKGYNQTYSIGATGGDEKAMYYFSLGYTGNKGVVKTTDFTRYNARFNADFILIKDFKLGMNIGFTRNERILLDDGVNNYTSPTWVSLLKAPFLSPYTFTTSGQKTRDLDYADDFGVSNPVAVIEHANNTSKKYRFNIGFTPVWTLRPDLALSSQFDYSVDKTVENHFDPYQYVPVRTFSDLNLLDYNNSSGQTMRNTLLYDESRLTFDKTFSKVNHVKAILGWRYLNNLYESSYLEEYNSKSNTKTTVTGGFQYLRGSSVSNATNSISNFLSGDYNYDNRYFINAVVSVDGSSRFGRNIEGGFKMFNRSWGVFPSVNAAWLISSEKFMKNVDAISSLKLRAGYGITGNDGIQDYASMAYFSAVQLMSSGNGLAISNLANDKIQWESTGRANAGIDLSLLNNRISFSFDYFKSNTDHLLTLKDYPEVTGLGQYWSNGGSMTNNGYELSANVKALNLKNVKWELGLSVGHYKNEITSLPNGEYTTSVYDGEVISRVGLPVGSFYGYKTLGVFSTQAEASTAGKNGYLVNENGQKFTAGDIHFVDVNNDGVIDAKDKQVIGNPNPDVYGTISSKLTYKHLSLNTLFTYSLGNDVYDYYRSQLESGSTLYNQSTAMLSRWTADGQVTSQPKAVYGDPMGNARFSDRWIEDGSYLRLKTVSLSYELPLKNNFIQGFTIWVSANNVFTLTKYLGLDPEFSAKNSVYYQGVDAGLIPLTRTYYLGIKLNL